MSLLNTNKVLTIVLILDKMKYQSIAKIYSQCEEFFGETVKLMERDTVAISLEKEWLAIVPSFVYNNN